MNKLPETLRLAEQLETEWGDDCELDKAAAELRRLHGQLGEAHKEIDEQARLLGMSAERELSLRAEIEQLKKIINKLVAQNGSESLISLLWGRAKG